MAFERARSALRAVNPIAVAFVVATLLLSIAAFTALRGIQGLVDADRRTVETFTRIAQLGEVLDATIDAQTGARGYIITGNPKFLEPYERGVAAATVELNELEALYASDGVRTSLLGTIRATVEAQRNYMAQTVAARRHEGAAVAAQLVASGVGKELTDSVRAMIAELVAHEREDLAKERADVEAATIWARRTIGIGVLTAVILLALAFAALARESQRRRDSAAKISELNGMLETRIESVRAELASSEARLLQSLDGLIEACNLLDFDLRYIYANPATARQGRTTVSAMLGRTFFEVFPGSEESAPVAAFRRALDERVAQHVELEFEFRDGSKGWFELHVQPVPQGLFVMSAETTERVKSERARLASEGRLRALLESLPEQVFVLDLQGAVLDFHVPAGVPQLAPADELLGRPLAAALAPVASERLEGAIQRVLDTGALQTVQFESDAAEKRSKFEAVVVATEGARLTVVVRDITLRESLEEQLRQSQKMEAVGQLTGGIAHDFNNVLTIIGSNAELLAASGDAQTAESLELREIQSATRRGAEMIARLLLFSRRGLLTRKRVEVRMVIRDFARMLERLLLAHVRLELGPLEAAEVVNLDAAALEQVIANLCTNARDAMPKGGTIRIDCQSAWLDAGYHATHPWVTPGPYVCVSVSDTGIGMDEQTRARVFEPFFTTKPVGVGTGLGLSMVYGIMKEHGGMVHVYSEVGRGTIVKLYFPVADATTTTTADAPKRTSNPMRISGGAECLLVAEDESAIRLATRRALESKGYEVLEASDGEQALARWRENRERVALVISDLVMPNLGGMQLVQALRAEGADVPVVFTSGYAAEAVHQEGGLPPDVLFLEKPWTLTQLFSTVRTALDAQ